MLSKEEWNANKDSTSIIYCFEDGTTKEITMAEYLRAHPEHSAEDFRINKELSDELLYHDYHSDNYHGYWKADKDFSGLAALVPSPEPGPLESLLRKEQLRFAFRVAARLLHSGKLTAVQRRCFIAYFIKGKTVAEIAHDEKTYRMTIWRHIRRLEAALRDAV